MITSNRQKNVTQGQGEDEFSSILPLQSYRSQRNRRLPPKPLNNQVSKNSYALAVIIALVLISAVILYLEYRCKLSTFFLQRQMRDKINTLQSKLKQEESQQQSLQRKTKEIQQKIQQQLQNKEILKAKISELDQEAEKRGLPKTENIKTSQNIKKISKQNIVDIQYKSGTVSVLPINLLKTQDGKGIAHFLYKDEAEIKRREQFIQQRINFINSKDTFPHIYLAKYNFVKNEQMLNEGISLNVKDWLRLQKRFKISSVTEELPMCVIVPGYNNNVNFRIEGNLNSIFTQNYTNYKIVIINDASTDKSNQTYIKYFQFYGIDKSKYVFIDNLARVTALQNIYEGSMNQCTKDSVIMILDGDDQFIGRNVLKVFNWAFQARKAGVVYSNFYWYQQQVSLRYGFTQQYSEHQKKNNMYRNVPMKFSQLRAFRAQLLHQIKPQDLKDQKGNYFTIAYDMALFLPLMEIACARVEKITEEFHYLYNYGTGLNDDYLNRGKQLAVDQKVRGQKKYECLKSFNQTMNKMGK